MMGDVIYVGYGLVYYDKVFDGVDILTMLCNTDIQFRPFWAPLRFLE